MLLNQNSSPPTGGGWEGGDQKATKPLILLAPTLSLPRRGRELVCLIQQHCRVGIIGRNGAGKSTLLKILSRITKPTTGKVHIKGRVASLLEVGKVFHSKMTRYITYPKLKGM